MPYIHHVLRLKFDHTLKIGKNIIYKSLTRKAYYVIQKKW